MPLGTFTAAGIVVQPTGIAAAPDGSAMYVADFGSGLVISLSIQGGGTLAVVNSVASLGTNGPGQPLGDRGRSRSGNFVYLTDRAGGVVSAFAVGAGNVLTFLASYPTAAITRQTFDLTLANNAAALFLYATNGTINTVSDFIVSTGVLSLESRDGRVERAGGNRQRSHWKLRLRGEQCHRPGRWAIR